MRRNQRALEDRGALKIIEAYARIFPFRLRGESSIVFDMTCGAGMKALRHYENVSSHRSSVDEGTLPVSPQDFGHT